MMIRRHWHQRRLENSVTDEHPMAEVLIGAGRWPNVECGYPTTDNTFRTLLGISVAAFDNVGHVFDLKGNFLGSLNSHRRR
jgi:hypothetical protein